MRFLSIFFITLFLLAGNLSAQPSDDALNKKIEKYILDNPEIIVKSLENYQVKQAKLALSRSEKALGENKEELFNSKTSPSLGAKNADVTIVEFFDYKCPYCKNVGPALRNILAQDKKIRVVFKEMPVLGRRSIIAASAALAAHDQGKYEEYHFALMKSRLPMSEAFLMQLAQNLGLDTEKFRKDMLNPKNRKEIERNIELAGKLAISGTPAFVIGDKIYRGAMKEAQIKAAIALARKAKK